MMPKVVLKAPPGVGGQIQASRSGRNYTIAPDGTVTVDSSDVRDLIGAGFVVQQQAGDPDTATAAPITSPSPTAAIEGATALDPAQREAGRRESPADITQQHQDYGGAVPPHGRPLDLGQDPVVTLHKEADAAAAAEAAQRAGAPQAMTSPEANTGNATQPAGTEAQQQEAAKRATKGETKGEPSA
ncbi:hypothetical protein FF100_29400 [Methylobacterium terricola]|uniref:Uncharacterized protein n=1 Tax=Methylobacterium terricola TaxID=2583531 RepID=A0A5C4L9I5_9HYPH|nr:hypothetical protein [Methylobacterium terricola]TNC08454.1 hypothetical protein FF100_29400 [Methylobacterium terricola]